MAIFRIKATEVADYFKYTCERQFRYKATIQKEQAGDINYVPGSGSGRAGIALLLRAGDEFEIEQIRNLEQTFGADQVQHRGVGKEQGRNIILPTSTRAFVATLQNSPLHTLPRFFAQVELTLTETEQAAFLKTYGHNPHKVELSRAVPDLIEVVAPTSPNAPYQLRIWDFKHSEEAKHKHFIQVAYYSILLEYLLQSKGLSNFKVDTHLGVVFTPDEEQQEFDLRPYRVAVTDFLSKESQYILSKNANEAFFHVEEKCMLCDYENHCKTQVNSSKDLSKIPYLTAASKQKLLEKGISQYPQLVGISQQTELAEALKKSSYDIERHLKYYELCAQALQDGQRRKVRQSTFLMPQYVNVRVALCFEQDPVNNICFAIGMRVNRWDKEEQKYVSNIKSFVAKEGSKRAEQEMLLEFLSYFNQLLRQIDAHNAAIDAVPTDTISTPTIDQCRSTVAQAEQTLALKQQALDDFKQQHPRITSTQPNADALKIAREELNQAVKSAQKNRKACADELKRAINKEQWSKKESVHFYVYNPYELGYLKKMIERMIASEGIPPALVQQLLHLIRLFTPESLLHDNETLKTVPGTIVTHMLKQLLALPVSYSYELYHVSKDYKAQSSNNVFAFRPKFGFIWNENSQVAFERIHDYWKGATFTHKPSGKVLSPDEILEDIRDTIKKKLTSIASIVYNIEKDFKEDLLLRKEAFRLHDGFDPLGAPDLERLRMFTSLESSLDELEIKTTHTLPVEERVIKLECISGMRYLHDNGNYFSFSFDVASKDAKFDEGDFLLAVSPMHHPKVLLHHIDRKLFSAKTTDRGQVGTSWAYRPYQVTLVNYDLDSSPPQLVLKPAHIESFQKMLEQYAGQDFVLDKIFRDYNTNKILSAIDAIPHHHSIASLLSSGTVNGWQPFVKHSDQLLNAVLDTKEKVYLNQEQKLAITGGMKVPLSLLWGPPGTGKTYTLAHILIAYSYHSAQTGQNLQILVTAFTHHAIVNLLNKTEELRRKYGIASQQLGIIKCVNKYFANEADAQLKAGIVQKAGDSIAEILEEQQIAGQCLVIGATVWAVHKSMYTKGELTQEWFDVVMVDEASQLRLPDTLIALAAAKHNANRILAGDDQQLPPIIKGGYQENGKQILSSVFAFVRKEVELSQTLNEKDIIFQLVENFRMNEPITGYPREAIYRGLLKAKFPEQRALLNIDAVNQDFFKALLHPEFPVVLCTYNAPQSFTARNPVESEIVGALTEAIWANLKDHTTGQAYAADKFSAEALAVLSPHRAQNTQIRNHLTSLGYNGSAKPEILVDTVDKLQGKERELILVSYGVADEEYAEAEASFLLSRNRFNVALTRAKKKVIVFCSEQVLKVIPQDQEVLKDAMILREFRQYCNDGQATFSHHIQEIDALVKFSVYQKGF